MKFLLNIFAISISFLLILVIGEYIASKFPKSKFNKFWRKNVIGVED